MVGTYDVYMDGERKGVASVSQLGLYYFIQADCVHPKNEMIHLLIHGSNWSEDLGLMVPTSLGWELKKKIPVKRVGKGMLRFSMEEQGSSVTEKERIDPAIPLSSLSYLDQSRLEINGTTPYLVYRKNS